MDSINVSSISVPSEYIRCSRCCCKRPASEFNTKAHASKRCSRCAAQYTKSKDIAHFAANENSTFISLDELADYIVNENASNEFDELDSDEDSPSSSTTSHQYLGISQSQDGPSAGNNSERPGLLLYIKVMVPEDYRNDPDGIASIIKNIVEDSDGYHWLLRNRYPPKRTAVSCTYYFFCSLCETFKKSPPEKRQRHYKSEIHFACNGKLTIHLSTNCELAYIEIVHEIVHRKPQRAVITESIKQFIRENVHQGVRWLCRNLPDPTHLLTADQVYFWWAKFSKDIYQRAANPYESTLMLLEEIAGDDAILLSTNDASASAIGFKTSFLNTLLLQDASICIDATYKTNRQGCELYAVIMNVNGVGFPLAYLLLQLKTGIAFNKTVMLQRFLMCLKERGLMPRYVFTDKDVAQINALKSVWEETKVCLCWWHVRRAMFTKIGSVASSACWTEHQKRALVARHSFVDNSFLSLSISSSPLCPATKQEELINLIQWHSNRHSLFPVDAHGKFVSSEDIYECSVREIYDFCFINSLPHLWRYLWVEWYSEAKWKLWARAAYPLIPIIRTNMLVEAHWKSLKRDYLYKFHQPRMDLLVHIIICRLVPQLMKKHYQLCKERLDPAWHKSFVEEWNSLSKRPIAPDSAARYYTDVSKWICSCKAFCDSRFLLCKHLVQSTNESAAFRDSRHVKRLEHYPFVMLVGINDQEASVNDDSNRNLNQSFDEISTHFFDHADEVVDASFESDVEELINWLSSHIKDDKVKGNDRQQSVIRKTLKPAFQYMRSVKAYNNKRTLPCTWACDEATMFLP